jgi:D-glycero-beta-D-manno-heptose-7-phosphate kinase
MKSSEIQSLFDSFIGKNIIILGDVMIDSYMWGSVNRISPEAPIPVVSVSNKENRLGGASNVALNIKSLGANPIMCSVVGTDDYSGEFIRLLEQNDMPTEGILRSPHRKTSVKTRIISQSQHLLRVDEEDTDVLNEETEKSLKEHFSQLMIKYQPDAIIFEDYDKGVITHGIINYVVNLANEKGIITTVDPKKRQFLDYHGVSLFKPNFKEMKEGLKTEFAKDNFAAIKGLTTKLIHEKQIQRILLTMADAGVIITNAKDFEHISAQVRNIADVSGAGDTVIATATLCLISNCNDYDIAFISNMAGGIVCEYSGVVPIQKQKLMDELLKKYQENVS